MPTPGRPTGRGRRRAAGVILLGASLAAAAALTGAPAAAQRGMGPEESGLWPTPTPAPPPGPRRLTADGCCAAPSWSPDSARVVFLDRPSPLAAPGWYAVGLAGSPPERLPYPAGLLSADWSLAAFRAQEDTVVQRLRDGRRWTIPNGGRAVWFAPGGARLAWQEGELRIANPDTRVRTIWVSEADGRAARQLLTVTGGSLLGWIDDGALLASGRLSPEGPAGLWRVAAADGEARLLARSERVRGASISPGGGWVAYYVAAAPDSAQNGLWVVSTRGGAPRELELFGGYRWRSEGLLLVAPLDLQAEGIALWQVEVESGGARRLTDPAAQPLPIAGNDWQVSPDGAWVVYRARPGLGLWALELPPP